MLGGKFTQAIASECVLIDHSQTNRHDASPPRTFCCRTLGHELNGDRKRLSKKAEPFTIQLFQGFPFPLHVGQ
jgi:hypothetical protein